MKAAIDENKKREQDIVLGKWKDAEFKGTWCAATGCGKTRVGVIASSEFIRRDNTENSIVIVPTENLRDNEWENSFLQWGYTREREKVEIVCIQTAYKYSGKHYNTVVMDEVHLSLSEQYGLFLKNNTFDRILCLTATPPEDQDKLNFLTSIAPVIWVTDTKRARELKLIAESLIFNLGVQLTEDERKMYDEINRQYLFYEHQLGGNFKAFDASSRFLRLQSASKDCSNMRVLISENRVIYAHEINEITIRSTDCRALTLDEASLLQSRVHQSRMFWRYMRNRRERCLVASNKIFLTKQICERYPDRKGIIFSEVIDFADRITQAIGDKCISFHSKQTDDLRKTALDSFKNGEKQYLSTVKALNTGLDVPDCSLGVATGGDSKKLARIQRTGRTSRYAEGKTSYFINLYAKDTQEFNWVRNGTRNEQVKWIESIDELPLK